jgi:hypothetical protein
MVKRCDARKVKNEQEKKRHIHVAPHCAYKGGETTALFKFNFFFYIPVPPHSGHILSRGYIVKR